MAISQWVAIREEIKKRELYGIIRLNRVRQRGQLESDGQRFLSITHPSTSLRAILESAIKKLAGQGSRGVFGVSGGGGTGKSHLLVALHHLFSGSPEAQQWMKENGIAGREDLPQGVAVVSYQLVAEGGGVSALWEPLFKDLAREDLVGSVKRWAGATEIKEAVGDRPVVILLDEWEDWYLGLKPEERQWNRNFLQNLSEFADSRDSRLVLVISSLERQENIRFVLSRPDIAHHDLNQDIDREEIVLFRLFSRRQPDTTTLEAFLQIYKGNEDIFSTTTGAIDSYRELVVSKYPLHPELLKVAFEAFGRHRLYQHTRGVLSLLGDIVRENSDSRELLLPADVNAHNREVQFDLNSLDSPLLSKFLEDLERVKDIPHAASLLTPILLWSLTEARGIEESRVLLGAVRPSVAIAVLQSSLRRCYDRCWYLRRRNGRYIFEQRRKIRVVVDERARTVLSDPKGKEEAQGKLSEIIKSLTSRGEIAGPEGAKAEFLVRYLDPIPDSTRLKVVISLLNLNDEEIGRALGSITNANTVAIILPKGGQNLWAEGDFLLHSRRLKECENLRSEVEKEELKELEEVEREERVALEKALREAYGRLMKPLPPDGQAHRGEPVSLDKKNILETLGNTFSPFLVRQTIKEKVEAQKEQGIGVGMLLSDFYKYRHLPMLLDRSIFDQAVKELVQDGVIGIEDGVKVYTRDDPAAIERLVIEDRMCLKATAYIKAPAIVSAGGGEEKPPNRIRERDEHGDFGVKPPPVKIPVDLSASTPRTLLGEVRNRVEEKAQIKSLTLTIKAEQLDEVDKIRELLFLLRERGIKGQISFSLSALHLSLSKGDLIALINKLPMPLSPTQLPPDAVTLHLEVESEGD